jgi:hypothetical protein
VSIETNVAWAAGLFEGEGSIMHGSYLRPTGSVATRRRLSMESSDEDVMRRFTAIVGAGSIHEVPGRKSHHKLMFKWETARWADIERILQSFMPYLGERRAEKARELLADPAGPVGRPPKLKAVV